MGWGRGWGVRGDELGGGDQPEHQRATLRQHQVGPQGPSRAAPSGVWRECQNRGVGGREETGYSDWEKEMEEAR